MLSNLKRMQELNRITAQADDYFGHTFEIW